MKMILAAFVLMVSLMACTNNQDQEIEHGTWLKGDQQAFVEAIERQFNGYSRAMVEVVYRYEELYWAGQDKNWEYAGYQLEHIVEAIEKGYERRPERKENSLDFLGAPADILQQAIDAKNLVQFNNAFKMFNAACKNCHIKEDVAFIQTIIPEDRRSVTRFVPAE